MRQPFSMLRKPFLDEDGRISLASSNFIVVLELLQQIADIGKQEGHYGLTIIA